MNRERPWLFLDGKAAACFEELTSKPNPLDPIEALNQVIQFFPYSAIPVEEGQIVGKIGVAINQTAGIIYVNQND